MKGHPLKGRQDGTSERGRGGTANRKTEQSKDENASNELFERDRMQTLCK